MKGSKRLRTSNTERTQTQREATYAHQLAGSFLRTGAFLQDAEENNAALDLYRAAASAITEALTNNSCSSNPPVQRKKEYNLDLLRIGTEKLGEMNAKPETASWSDPHDKPESYSTKCVTHALHLGDLCTVDGEDRNDRKMLGFRFRGLLLYNIGMIYYKRGMIDQATRNLEIALNSIMYDRQRKILFPSLASATILCNLSHLYFQCNKPEESLAMLEQAEAVIKTLAKKSSGVYEKFSNCFAAITYNRGLHCYMGSKHEDSLQALQKATSLHCSASLFHSINQSILFLGREHKRKGLIDLALDYYKLAWEVIPIYCDAYSQHPCPIFCEELLNDTRDLHLMLGSYRQALKVSVCLYKLLSAVLGNDDSDVMALKHSIEVQRACLLCAEVESHGVAAAA